MTKISEQIAQELNVKTKQIDAAISLLDDGATVPFIARYRKEATKGLDDNHLRHLAQRLSYLRDLEDRRHVILTSIKQQNKLTPSLEQQIQQAESKTRLEDLYLPYKPKRRTKGFIAIEAGIKPLADSLFNNWQLNPEREAVNYINKLENDKSSQFSDVKAVLDGAMAILVERFCEDANLLQKLRRHLMKQANLVSSAVKAKEKDKFANKYQDYFSHNERLQSVPSHRILAMLRGRNEGFLQLSIDVDPNQDLNTSSAEQIISEHFTLRLNNQAGAKFLQKVVHSTWKSKLYLSLTTEILTKLREQAELDAIKIFSSNLGDLLMAAPAGEKVTLGLDPGLRTGCKIAIVSKTGSLLNTTTIFPHAPQNHWEKSIKTLTNLCRQFSVELIAIGNGTGSRESDKLITELRKKFNDGCEHHKEKPKKMLVSEAGASVYSASEFAANEFPDLDVSLRGAVSIARRLQDPLAELVKIDPKAIGVGLYQHDVSQSKLSKTLDDVVEDCVNAVGVDLNSASVALLMRVSGLNKTMAGNIVTYRSKEGRFTNRKQLKKVPRLGPKAFEQAAGFLRITKGENPLDCSAVHPETYPIVDSIIKQLNIDAENLFKQSDQLKQLDIGAIVDDLKDKNLANDHFGEFTVNDVIKELEKPNRDPRPEFIMANFAEGINAISDLKVGMLLEGIISNVANFGAFVDVGVHQDGLVHISSITNKFISDPREIVKAGDIVKVKVLEVDIQRKRISLTMRLDEQVESIQTTQSKGSRPKEAKHQEKIQSKQVINNRQQNKTHQKRDVKRQPKKIDNAAMGNAFADAFAKLKK